jgi:hypothetical protein
MCASDRRQYARIWCRFQIKIVTTRQRDGWNEGASCRVFLIKNVKDQLSHFIGFQSV